MRIVFFIIALMFSAASFAQDDCSKLKNGTFRQADEGRGELVITRKGKVQTEENFQSGLKLSMEIVWTGNCTYVLKNMKVLKGEFPFQVPDDAELHNEIIEVTNKSYRVRSWMSFAPDQKFEFTLQII